MTKFEKLLDNATLVSSVGLLVIGAYFALTGHYDRAAFDIGLAVYARLLVKIP
jgi:hypothetical protein